MKKQPLIRPLVRLLALLVLMLVATSQVVASRAAAPASYPSQNLSGDEALRFLQDNGLYETVADGLPPDGRPFVQTAKLHAGDGDPGDRFGGSVAVNGETVIVGAPYANSGQGAAFVFTRTGADWTPQGTLTATNGTAGDYFGSSVAVGGDTALVGAYGTDVEVNGQLHADQGAAYVFTRTGTTWTEQGKLTASDGAASDYFGQSVSISGESALVGAPYAKVDANAAQGAAYLFIRQETNWSQQDKLLAFDGAEGSYFGVSVSPSSATETPK